MNKVLGGIFNNNSLLLACVILAGILLHSTATAAGSVAASTRSKYVGAINAPAPMSLASDYESRLFVGSFFGKITVLDYDGNELYSFGGPEDRRLSDILYEPADMFYYDGKLYVVDAWFEHVIVFGPDGEVSAIYGRGGGGRKRFNEPRGIYVKSGLIYVSDTGNSRIQVLGPNGIYLSEIGGDVTVSVDNMRVRPTVSPTDLTVNNAGDIVVVDVADSWVKVFNRAGDFVKILQGPRRPVGVIPSGDGVAVADLAQRLIQRFSGSKYNPQGAVGLWGKGARPFQDMNGFTWGGGNIFVGDSLAGEIKVMSLAGTDNSSVDDGVAPISYAVFEDEIPTGDMIVGKIVNSPEGLYMLDMAAKRVVLGSSGQATPLEMDGCSAVSFALGPVGSVFCLDGIRQRLVVQGPEGEVSEIPLPVDRMGEGSVLVDIAVAGDGTIYLADRGAGSVHMIDAQGGYIGFLGKGGLDYYIKDPVQVSVDQSGLIYVADAFFREIYIFSRSGRLLRSLWDNDDIVQMSGLSFDGEYLYVLDAGVPDIKVYSKQGRFIFSFGSGGTLGGEFDGPAYIDILPNAQILVSDTGNKRIQRISVYPR